MRRIREAFSAAIYFVVWIFVALFYLSYVLYLRIKRSLKREGVRRVLPGLFGSVLAPPDEPRGFSRHPLLRGGGDEA